jgi:peptide/nickel transport system substrate-binding protein
MSESDLQIKAERAVAIGILIVSMMVMPFSFAQQSAPYGGILKLGESQSITELNPTRGTTYTTSSVFRELYDTLVTNDPQMNYVPELARSWEISPDGLTWTMHLQQGVTWTDGVPFTSADVKFSFDQGLVLKVPLPYSLINWVQNVEIPDDLTVILHLKSQTAVALFDLASLVILPKHIWGNMTAQQTYDFSNLPVVGDGAFKFVEWKQGQYVRLQANDHYWRGRPYVDELWFVYYSSPETELAALRSGEIDAMFKYVNPSEIPLLKTDPNLNVTISPGLEFRDIYTSFGNYASVSTSNYNWNTTTNPALGDVKVRQAILRSINKENISALVHNGVYIPALTGVPKGISEYYDPNLANELNLTFNLPAAAQMLENAGYRIVDNSGIRQAVQDIKIILPDGKTTTVPKGTKLDFDFAVTSDYPDEVRSAEMINGWLHQVGMNLKISSQDDGTLTAAELTPYEYDMQLWSWNSYADPDFILSIYITNSINGNNCEGYSNPTYDQLFMQQRQATSESQRIQIVHEMEKILLTDLPDIPLYYVPAITAYRINQFTGWVFFPQGLLGGAGGEGYPRATTSVHLISAPSTGASYTSATSAQTTTEQPGIPTAVVAIPIIIIIALLGYVVYRRRKRA